MTAVTAFPVLRSPGVADLVGELRRREPLLFAFALLMLALMVPTVVAFLVDPRQLNGIPIWQKPLKFEFSVALYFGTLAWFMGFLNDRGRQSRVLRWAIGISVAAMTVEMLWIVVQPARGLHSHFNQDTLLDGIMFSVMGVCALIFTGLGAVIAWAVARWPRADLAPAFRRSVVLGLVMATVLGITTGALIATNGGHWVGGSPTDAGGLPVFGWSRTGGDLRVAHFFGLHALQIVPAAGFLIALWRPRAALLMTVLALAYAAATVGLAMQALAARPFLPFIG